MSHPLGQFLAMGGYAAFVWPAYGASVLGLGAAIALTIRAYSRAKASLAALERAR
jgi:heme exporter protein D